MEKTNKNQTINNAKIALSQLTSFLNSNEKNVYHNDDNLLKTTPIVKKDEPKANVASTYTQASIQPKAVSIISENTEISGNIVTKGDLEVQGNICGNICASGKVIILGTVKGDIDAEELIVKKGSVVSKIIAIKKTIIVEEGSEVSGNINCENAVVNSKVTGNICAVQKCELQSLSAINGDIKASKFSVQTGAMLAGKIEITVQANSELKNIEYKAATVEKAISQ